jgi:hypothetical protein
MSRSSTTGLIIGVIGLVVVVVLALGGTVSRTTSGVSELQAPDPEAGPSVSGLFVDPGTKVLGIRLSSSTYRVRVQFTASPECFENLTGGADWPIDHESCRSDVPITGTVAGSGRTAFGDTVVVVERKITRTCYEALLNRGATPWPVSAEACLT